METVKDDHDDDDGDDDDDDDRNANCEIPCRHVVAKGEFAVRYDAVSCTLCNQRVTSQSTTSSALI